MGVARIAVVAASCSLVVAGCAPSTPDGDETVGLALPGGPVATDASPLGVRPREVQVVVGLAAPPVAVVAAEQKAAGNLMTATAQRAHGESVLAAQDEIAGRVRALGGREVARLSVALNAVVVAVDASLLDAIAAMPGVVSVRPVRDHQVDLSETVPYVGATAVHGAGFDGTGVRVAVLDSGIDYTHRNLGGSGVVADFTANDETIVEPGTFPTAKVVGGTDFVGSRWPNNADANGDPFLEPDPDPLDKCPAAPLPCNSGHGTHVSDIIGGETVDAEGARTHAGVAPGASLYAVKVCSSTSTACSGVALLQGMDFALDPNGDGDVSDAVDAVNMSLGSSYGQREDDLSAASANAVHLGVVVVASAGNSADRPFITGSPASTPEVISVAQTQVPSAKLYTIVAGAVTAGGSWQAWSAAPALVSGPLRYDTTSAETRRGCTNAAGASPWTGTPFAGQVVLVDRGTCAISMKVSNVAAAGGLAAVVANNVSQGPGDLPPDFSFGGGSPTVAGYSITQADGNALKGVLPADATIDPGSAASLAGNMVSSSSRGPSYSFAAVKPDIGAPGASLSAQFGTGTGETAFGGTSGAAPMVTGAVALLRQAFPARSPFELKSLLMNTAERDVGINPVAGVAAPVSRIGGGELRVNAARASTTAAWDAVARTGSLSFGYQAVVDRAALERQVTVRNYSSVTRTYTITPSFRFADDAASGAVRISTPSRISVPGNSARTFPVRLRIDAAGLPVWNLNGGSRGGDGFRLQGVEFDGYVRIQDASDDIHVAWHVLPHRSAAVEADGLVVLDELGTGAVALANEGDALDGRVEVFSLTGMSPPLPRSVLPADGDNFAIVDLRAVGVRIAGTAIQFAVDTFGRRAHPAYPAEFDVFIDTDDPATNPAFTPDFAIFNLENGAFASTGQTVVAVADLAANTATAFFFADADLQSGNAILTAPLAALGLTPTSRFDFAIGAFDNYFTGRFTDGIGLAFDTAGNAVWEPMTYTPGTSRFAAAAASLVVPADGQATLAVSSPAGGDAASPSQKGFLLMYRDQREQREADLVFVLPDWKIAHRD